MPEQQLHLYQETTQEDFTIARYMNLAKFLSLLTNSSLYFCRLDRLKRDDPFEGSLNRNDMNSIMDGFLKDESLKSILTQELIDNIFDIEREIREKIVNSVVVNCWHIIECDSYAMWKLYSGSEYGIAITSTNSKLKHSMSLFRNVYDKPYDIQPVIYKNYELEKTLENHHLFNDLLNSYLDFVQYNQYVQSLKTYDINQDSEYIKKFFDWQIKALNFYKPLIFSKRNAFEYEKELRVLSLIQIRDNWANNNQLIGSLEVPVILDYFIDEIFVSPAAPDWFRESVQKIIDKFELNKTVWQSNLLTPPNCF